MTVYRWVQRFTPLFADAARLLRHATGDRWFVDETYVKVAGRWRYLYRAVDQYGQVIDVMMTEQRDTAAASRFFIRALRYGPAPVEVTTDKARPGLLHRAILCDLDSRSSCAGQVNDRPERCSEPVRRLCEARPTGPVGRLAEDSAVKITRDRSMQQSRCRHRVRCVHPMWTVPLSDVDGS